MNQFILTRKHKKHENFLRSKGGLNSDGVVKFGLVHIKTNHTVYIHMNLRLFFFKEKLVALEKIGAATFVTKMEII